MKEVQDFIVDMNSEAETCNDNCNCDCHGDGCDCITD